MAQPQNISPPPSQETGNSSTAPTGWAGLVVGGGGANSVAASMNNILAFIMAIQNELLPMIGQMLFKIADGLNDVTTDQQTALKHKRKKIDHANDAAAKKAGLNLDEYIQKLTTDYNDTNNKYNQEVQIEQNEKDGWSTQSSNSTTTITNDFQEMPSLIQIIGILASLLKD